MTYNDLFFSALFLVDAEHCLYLWQGWFPVVNSNMESNDDGNIVTTGAFSTNIMTIEYSFQRD